MIPLRLLFIALLVVVSCSKNNATDIDAIKQVLTTQQTCWNNGDIDGFMLGYWNSEKFEFSSENHGTTYGWKNTLERYKESYPTVRLQMIWDISG